MSDEGGSCGDGWYADKDDGEACAAAGAGDLCFGDVPGGCGDFSDGDELFPVCGLEGSPSQAGRGLFCEDSGDAVCPGALDDFGLSSPPGKRARPSPAEAASPPPQEAAAAAAAAGAPPGPPPRPPRARRARPHAEEGCADGARPRPQRDAVYRNRASTLSKMAEQIETITYAKYLMVLIDHSTGEITVHSSRELADVLERSGVMPEIQRVADGLRRRPGASQ